MEDQVNVPKANTPMSDLDINLKGKELTKRNTVKWVLILFVPLIVLNIVLLIFKSNLGRIPARNSGNNFSLGQQDVGQTNPSGGEDLVNQSGLINYIEDLGPEEVVKLFLDYNLKNDKTSARQLIVTRALESSFKSSLDNYNDKYSLYGKSFTYEVGASKMSTDGDVAYVLVKITGSVEPVSHLYVLVKEDSIWKLVNDDILM